VSDKSQVKVYLPDELHQLLNADSRSNSEAVEAALWSEFGGRKKSALEAKKESKLDQAKAIKASIETDQEEYYTTTLHTTLLVVIIRITLNSGYYGYGGVPSNV